MSITRVTCPRCRTVQFQVTDNQTVDFNIACVSCSYIGDFTNGQLKQESQSAGGFSHTLNNMLGRGRHKTNHQYQASDGSFKRSGASMRDFVKNRFSQYNPLKVYFSKSNISKEEKDEIKKIAKEKARRRRAIARKKREGFSFSLSGSWIIILIALIVLPILFFISKNTSLEKNNFAVKSLYTEEIKLKPKKLSFHESVEGFFSKFFARYEYQIIKKELSTNEMLLTINVRSKHQNNKKPNVYISLYDFKNNLIKKYKYPVGRIIPKGEFTEVSIRIYNQPFNTARVKVKVK